MMQVFQEGARKQAHSANHHVRPGVDDSVGERPHEEVSAENDVQDAGHEQFDQLGSEYGPSSEFFSEASLRDVLVAEPHLGVLASALVRLVKALHKDLSGVAANVGDAHHCQDGPVSTVQNPVGQGDDEHALD